MPDRRPDQRKTTAADFSRKNVAERYGVRNPYEEERGGASRGADASRRRSPSDDKPRYSRFSREAPAENVRVPRRHPSFGAARLARFRKPVLIGALLILIALLVAGFIWYFTVSSTMQSREDVSGSVVAEPIGQPYYVLLLGSDSRSEATSVARSDTIMLVRVDELKKQVTLISLPRDLKVEITGHGTCKLNSALTYGGVSGAIDAVSDVAGVKISYYATIYFSGFKDLVDELGGVTVYVPAGTSYKGVSLKEGTQTLNGKQALVLARCRKHYLTGDYQRTTNQRNLMKAIVKKTLKQPFWALPGLVSALAKNIETNMPAYKFAWLALVMKGMDADKMYSATVPSSSQMINGVSFVVADESAWKAMMKRVEAGEDPNG